MSGTNDNAPNLPTDQYWASVESDKLPDVIRAKALEFRKRLEADGRIDLWQRATRCYYGLDPEGGFRNSASVTFGGPQGEMVMMRVNHFHSIAQGIHTTVAKVRPSFDARALSTDTEALGQAQLATGVIEAYFKEIGLEAFEAECARMAWVLAEGWTALRWNPFKGDVIGVTKRPVLEADGSPKLETVEQDVVEFDDATGLMRSSKQTIEQPVTEDWPEREGDVEAQVFAPQEVVRSLDSTSRELEWVILPYQENVWDLAARYPQHREKLIAQRGQQRWSRTSMVGSAWTQNKADNADMVTVWWLYHMPTSACVQGRHAQVCGDVVIVDRPMDFKEVPCWGLIPELEMVTGSGYSLAFDLLALCQAYDSIWDIVLSSHDALGGQYITAPKNSDITQEQLERSLTLLNYTPHPDSPNGGKPEGLNMLAISADSFKLLEMLPHIMETLSGLNSVARGEPAPNLKSGTALALVQSLAVSFNSGFQGEVVRHLERVATGLLRLLQQFASNKRMSEVTGRTKRSSLQQWSSEKISKVSRVAVEIASPLMQAESGRIQVGQDLLQQGLIKTPQKYLELLATGNIEQESEAEVSRVRHIRTENEMMMAGKVVQIGKYDDHCAHVLEHLGLLDSPEARENQPLADSVLQHIDQHMAIWATMPLPVAIATRQSVMPPPPPMPIGLPPGGPSGPPHPPPSPGGPPGPTDEPSAPKATPLGQDGGANMPAMPKPPPNAPPS